MYWSQVPRRCLPLVLAPVPGHAPGRQQYVAARPPQSGRHHSPSFDQLERVEVEPSPSQALGQKVQSFPTHPGPATKWYTLTPERGEALQKCPPAAGILAREIILCEIAQNAFPLPSCGRFKFEVGPSHCPCGKKLDT